MAQQLLVLTQHRCGQNRREVFGENGARLKATQEGKKLISTMKSNTVPSNYAPLANTKSTFLPSH